MQQISDNEKIPAEEMKTTNDKLTTGTHARADKSFPIILKY